MSEKKMVTRNAVISVGIICIILVACLVGAFAYYVPMVNDKNSKISSLNSQIAGLRDQIQLDNYAINSLEGQVAELENQLASNNSLIASDNATIANLQNQIAELTNNLDSLQFQYEQLNQTYTSSFLFNSSDGMPSPSNSWQPQIFITYPAGFQEYANAILKICDTALTDYCYVFGMYDGVYVALPPVIYVFISTNASSITLVHTAEDYRIYLYVRSIKDMANTTYIHWIYGFIYELGAITFSIDNDYFGDGWINYADRFRILPDVYSQLGDDAWPQPYNYSQVEGIPRFLNQINNSSLTTYGSSLAASKVCYVIDQEYGPLIFAKAMENCHPTLSGFYNYPTYNFNEFKNALISLTNDTSLLQLFSENGF